MSLPWRKRRHLDYLASEDRPEMTLAERGALVELEDFHAKHGSIPADANAQRRMLMAQPEEYEAIERTVARFFHPSAEDSARLVNDDILAEIREREEFSAKQAAKGRTGGRPKASEKPEKSHSLAAEKPQLSSGKAGEKPNTQHNNTQHNLFAQWWEFYPRKTAKADALKAYREIVVEGKAKPEQRDDLRPYPHFAERHAQLVTATKRWARLEFAKRDADKVPYPATYLRRLDWLSAPQAPAPNSAPIQMAWESDETYQARLAGELQ